MGEIPRFPRFVTIDLAVKQEINKITECYPVYSDSNFVNLWSWNLQSRMSVALLHDNLVFKFRDYITGETFFSFIGHNRLMDTARTLLDEATKHGYLPRLRLIPEFCARVLSGSDEFTVREDSNNHDYIISLPDTAALAGKKQAHTRRLVRRFCQNFGTESEFVKLEVGIPSVQDQLYETFLSRERKKSGNDHVSELQALERLLKYESNFDLHAYGIYVDKVLKAFIICELTSQHLVIGHFWKADATYTGIYHYLLHKVSVELGTMGYTHMNIEQDLGIEGLRRAKSLLRPVAFMKKFTIEDSGYLPPFDLESPEDMQHIRIRKISRQLVAPLDRTF